MAGVLTHSDIGISSGAYAGLPLADALSRIAELAPSAEVCSYGRHSLLKPENVRAVEAAGLPFAVHGPFTHAEFGSRSTGKHRVAVEVHRRHMEAAAALGARLYVVHPDLRAWPSPRDRKVVALLERSFAALRVLQDEYGLCVAVENMPLADHSHFTAPGDLDLQGLGVTLDVGHAALTGTLEAWLTHAPGLLRHVHLHDNLGVLAGDWHQPLGTGVVDAAPILVVAREAGATIVLEHVNEVDVIASLEHLRARDLLWAPVG